MKRLLKAFIYSCVFAAISLLSVSYYWSEPVLLTVFLIMLSSLMLLVWRSKEDLVLYVTCGTLGAMAESFAIGFGTWFYAFPNFKNIPYWLPFLWGMAALFIKRISFEIHDFINSSNKRNLEEIRAKFK